MHYNYVSGLLSTIIELGYWYRNI